jgi:cell division septation protein DedD
MSGGGTRHRFELTRLEIAGVVISAAASLFIVFLLGVYAGRGLGEHRLVDEARVVRLPIPPAAEETPSRDTDLTFDDTLSRGSRAAAADDPVPVPADERPARERDAASGAPAAAAERAADAEHEPAHAAASGDHAAEPARVATGAGGGGHDQAPEAHAAPAAHAPEGHAGEGGTHAPSTPGHAPDARVAVALAGPVDATPPTGARGIWSVQVTATRESHTANDLVRRLRAKGYDAYVVRAPRQGGMFYRVRVGHFPSMDGASQMVSRLRREPGVPEAFVASD